MGVIIGVPIGYALGSRARPDAWTEFEEAWHTISTSEEVRDLAAGAPSIAVTSWRRGRTSSPASWAAWSRPPACGRWPRDP